MIWEVIHFDPATEGEERRGKGKEERRGEGSEEEGEGKGQRWEERVREGEVRRG